LNVEFIVSYTASLGPYSGNLVLTFPSANNTYTQYQARMASYVWDSNSVYWVATDFRTTSTTYIAY
jgi:hypothetical protein